MQQEITFKTLLNSYMRRLKRDFAIFKKMHYLYIQKANMRSVPLKVQLRELAMMCTFYQGEVRMKEGLEGSWQPGKEGLASSLKALIGPECWSGLGTLLVDGFHAPGLQ